MMRCPGCGCELEKSFKIFNETFYYCLDCVNDNCLLGAKSPYGFEVALENMKSWNNGDVSI